ncbi:hypothetical protein B9G98_01043 [Wickerhamiella sorbophila]|uniref:Pre-mRNA-splicing factor SLU7 n=1 Tax=Wickerhamiella sorbophila TaxID=45607 RepID=A0A2T0FEJ4_9ASCO|nr:hypothetical protein B9G98_01043 [Wickerhamiella sorbophila]PRT53423.1 hypothetical protein B9G98_01043 [Wickerhamiella sorbophila]
MDNEKIVVGSDGKKVAQRIPGFVAAEVWYKRNAINELKSNKENVDLEYAAKRDPYANYDSSMVSKSSHSLKRRNIMSNLTADKKPIIDEYSKVVAVSSQRERSDLAHYLEDVPKLEFDIEASTVTSPIQNSHSKPMNLKTNQEASGMPESELICKQSMTQSSVLAAADYGEEVKQRNGHKAVFGSFFQNNEWGYKCCKSLTFNSNCSAT